MMQKEEKVKCPLCFAPTQGPWSDLKLNYSLLDVIQNQRTKTPTESPSKSVIETTTFIEVASISPVEGEDPASPQVQIERKTREIAILQMTLRDFASEKEELLEKIDHAEKANKRQEAEYNELVNNLLEEKEIQGRKFDQVTQSLGARERDLNQHLETQRSLNVRINQLNAEKEKLTLQLNVHAKERQESANILAREQAKYAELQKLYNNLSSYLEYRNRDAYDSGEGDDGIEDGFGLFDPPGTAEKYTHPVDFGTTNNKKRTISEVEGQKNLPPHGPVFHPASSMMQLPPQLQRGTAPPKLPPQSLCNTCRRYSATSNGTCAFCGSQFLPSFRTGAPGGVAPAGTFYPPPAPGTDLFHGLSVNHNPRGGPIKPLSAFTAPAPAPFRWEDELRVLQDMGFQETDKLKALLIKHGGKNDDVLNELLNY